MNGLLEVGREIGLTRLDLGVRETDFLDERGRDEAKRQDHDYDRQAQRGERRQIAPFAEFSREITLQRLEQDREDRAPEDRAKERQQDPAERNRDNKQQKMEEVLVNRAVIHEIPEMRRRPGDKREIRRLVTLTNAIAGC